MDSTGNQDFVHTILQESKMSSKPSLFSNTYTSSSSSSLEWLSNISLTSWIIIILFLSFLGFNIFVYLAKGTDWVTNLIAPITEFVFGTTTQVGGQIIDVSAEGAKEVVQQTASVAESTLSAIQDITPNENGKFKGEPYVRKPREDVIQNTPLSKQISSSSNRTQAYTEDEADSAIQKTGKAGWCYVGTDRGFRSCAEVGVQDSCLSGDIFPSHEICINPSLRP